MSISSTEVNEVNLIALQKEVGDSPKFSIIKCENWGQSRKTQLVFTVKPTTVEEVQIVVRAARRCNLKVWGTLFSFLIQCVGTLCGLSTKIKTISVHRECTT